MKLSARFKMTETNLKKRLEFIGLGEAERALLASLLPWARDIEADLAREFYDRQFAFGPTRTFFEAMARKKGMSLETLRTALERTQGGYFVQIFEAAAGGGFDLAYFERRLIVGRTHDVIDLPPKWYLGSYTTYEDLVWMFLPRSGLTLEQRMDAFRAINKVFNLDKQAVVDAYLLSVFQSAGLALDQIHVPPGEDMTSSIGQVKSAINTALVEVVEASEAVSIAAATLSGFSDELSGSSHAVASAIEEIGAAIREIARSSSMASGVAVEGQKVSADTLTHMKGLGQASARIGDVVKVIEDVASHTNLLALNASIEAARAGQAGKGFAVVASEVKTLSRQTSDATQEIASVVDRVQEGSTMVGRRLEAVEEYIQQIGDHQTSIAAAVEEQSTVIHEIGRTAATAADISEQTRDASCRLEEVSAGLEATLSRFNVSSLANSRPSSSDAGESDTAGASNHAVRAGAPSWSFSQ